MSLKRQLQNQYHNFVYSLTTIRMPAWIDMVWIKATLMSVVVLFGFMYLLQTNNTANSGYEIHKLEKQIAVIGADVQKIEISVASERAMPNIQKRLNEVNMVAVEKIYHVAVPGASVAMR